MNANLDLEALEQSVHDYGDGFTDTEFVVPSRAKRTKRKSTAGVRKIHHAWQDEEIIRLIAIVEQHRRIWDVGSDEYKLSKLDGWRSVVNELCIDDVDVNEAKFKWSALRTTFMTNLALLRKKKSGQGANDSCTVNWKFFRSMMFLEANNVQQSTLSTSTLQLQSSVSDKAIVEQFSDSSQPSTSQVAVGSRRKRQSAETPTPPPSPQPSSGSSSVMGILNNPVVALNSNDSNSTFCDHLLAELRTLSEEKARILRHKLGRLMFDYMEVCEAEPPQLSRVRIVDEHGRDLQLNDLIVVQQNIARGQNSSAFTRPAPKRPPAREEATDNTQSIA